MWHFPIYILTGSSIIRKSRTFYDTSFQLYAAIASALALHWTWTEGIQEI